MRYPNAGSETAKSKRGIDTPSHPSAAATATFTSTTGATRAAEDVWFQVDKTYTIATEWLHVPADIAALPDLAGYGNVYDLHQAIEKRRMSGEACNGCGANYAERMAA